jgi:hypothetical protein
MKFLLEIAPVLGWAILWFAGGWMLAASHFRLRRRETAMVGLGLGLVLQAWLTNLLAHGLPDLTALWLSAALIFIAGIASAIIFRHHVAIEFSWSQWLSLGLLSLLFYAIGRGLGIFDDYQNLPTISLMAAGDLPPHFALNPSLNFGYHYLLLLMAAEAMRLGHMFPWTALDGVRALVLALPLMLAGLWAHRITHSWVAGFLTSLVLAFAGGTRWLLLLLPPGVLPLISSNITLIGSASTSGANLAEAMLSNWKIDGAGPIPFPFAFYTGINQPYIMAYTGISGLAILIVLLLLLTAGRWQHWSAGIISAALLAALAVANEVGFGLIVIGFMIAIHGWISAHHSLKSSKDLLAWTGVFTSAGVIAIFQGGLLTEFVHTRFSAGTQASTYFDASPTWVWPPAVISAHLGSLSLTNLSQLIAAMAEIGPIILVTPLVFIWAWKSLKLGKWIEAALISSSLVSLLALFIAFKGPLFTATSRLMSGWFFACILYSGPLLWIWARKRGDLLRIGVVTLGLVTTLSGLVLFGIQLIAIQKPVLATFITPMDAQMSQDYWNKLKPGALVFDPIVYRAPTIFGRFTNSSPSWYQESLQWQALETNPDPYKLRSAGFDYMYFGIDYWDGLTPAQQLLFTAECVKIVAQVDGIHSEKDYRKDYRRLLDIRTCQK